MSTMEDMKAYLHRVLVKVDGLLCILITDRDGVPLLRAFHDKTPEAAMRPSFFSTFAMATDQGSKLGIGISKSLVCIYSEHQVVQINSLPLVITFIATNDSNTGHILELQSLLTPVLNKLKSVFTDAA